MPNPDTKVDFILDSGAYSAWKTQTPLVVGEYIDFILKYTDCIHEFVNLDKIPGQWGQKPSRIEVEESAEVGWKNLLAMEKAGLKAMPVFHQHESIYWLEKMIDHGCTYIGISPANDRTTPQKQVWLDEVFGILCGRSGFPKVRTHGFGMTSVPLLFRYPWYSADSITWLLLSAYGSVMVPESNPDGTYNYCTSPRNVFLSSLAGIDKYERGEHFRTMGPNRQEYTRKYLATIGFKPEDLTGNYETRSRANCAYFRDLAKSYTIQPFFQQRQGFFSNTEVSKHGVTTRQWDHIKLVFTVTLSNAHSEILNEYDQRDRLLSYWYFKAGKGFDVRDYVKTGLMPPVLNKRAPSVKKPKPRGLKFLKTANAVHGMSLSAALEAASFPLEIAEELEGLVVVEDKPTTRRKKLVIDDDNDDEI